MSNDVCGYIEPISSQDRIEKLSHFIKHSQLGIQKNPKNKLYNYPDNLIPVENIFSFLIGDVPDYPNATY